MGSTMIRAEIHALAERGDVTLNEWKSLRVNSWEFELLVPKLTNEALAHVANQMIENCAINQRRPFVVYNDAVIGLIAPELVRRLGDRS